MTKEPEEDIHFRVLRILEQRPGISQRELAREVGVALGKANFLLVSLGKKGLIEARKFRASSNKLKYAYILTPAGLNAKAELLAGFLRRRTQEYDALRHEIESLKDELDHSPDTAPVSREMRGFRTDR